MTLLESEQDLTRAHAPTHPLKSNQIASIKRHTEPRKDLGQRPTPVPYKRQPWLYRIPNIPASRSTQSTPPSFPVEHRQRLRHVDPADTMWAWPYPASDSSGCGMLYMGSATPVDLVSASLAPLALTILVPSSCRWCVSGSHVDRSPQSLEHWNEP